MSELPARQRELPAQQANCKIATKDAIAQAFLEILGEKDFSKISVNEVCNRAGVHRTTFYLHFHRIDDVLLFALDELFSRVEIICWDPVQHDGDHEKPPLCQYLRAHPDYCPIFFDPGLFRYVTGRALSYFGPATKKWLEQHGSDASESSTILTYLLHGCIGVTLLNLSRPDDEWETLRATVDKTISPRFDLWLEARQMK